MKHCGRCGTLLQDRDLDKKRLACPKDGCGYVFYNNPLPVVAALVEYDSNHVILVQNKGWPKSWFGLVTGFIEPKEEPTVGCLRELKEELGLDGKIESLIGVYNFPQRNELIIAYHVKATGEIKMDEKELQAYKLVKFEDIKPWSFGTGHAVRDWLKKRNVTSKL
ncbi:nudix domain-containing protein NudC [Acrasis kona]|uniref:Nudix domain-containing protein NudC n=1 Tax=Acrasis kona TaxID=1008807 RepID=A0AAW2ZM20_9EUKA